MNDELIQAEIGDAVLFKPITNVDTWVFDPPYNIGYGGYETVTDKMSWEEYESQMQVCAEIMADATPNGSLFMINYAEQTSRLLPVLESAGWKFHQWITWVYPSNIGVSKKKFTPGSRTVLWMVRGKPKLRVENIKLPFRDMKDKRNIARMEAGSKGRNAYDWWDINLRKNVSKGYRGWANQLPFDLVKRCIESSTDPGDVVGDLMAGSGTLYEVARRLGRISIKNDIAPSALDHWKDLAESESVPPAGGFSTFFE